MSNPTHFIVITEDGFLTPRRATGRMYVNRVDTESEISEAKVYNTKSAAVNSARQAGYERFHLVCLDLTDVWQHSKIIAY